MFRKLAIAAAVALGLGGGIAAAPAEAAVVQSGAAAAVAGSTDVAGSAVIQAQYYYGYRPRYHRPRYYGPRCRVVWRRVYDPYYGWRQVRRRVCRY